MQVDEADDVTLDLNVTLNGLQGISETLSNINYEKNVKFSIS